jgi:hypothetical protein
MMGGLYQVVFTGELQPDISAEQAARDFAAVFKVPEQKATELVFGRSEHVLKKEVDEANAQRYREVLEEIGLVVRVEPVDPRLSSATQAPEAEPEPAAARMPAETGRPANGEVTPRPKTAGPSGAEPPPINPYAPPAADLTPPAAASGGLLGAPRRLPAGQGWQWITCGFEHFRRAPGPWLGAVALFSLVTGLLGLIPVFGAIASGLLAPMLLGGLMLGAHRQREGRRFRFATLFDAFSGYGSRLAAVGGFYLIGALVIAVVLGLVMGVLMAGVLGTNPQAIEQQDPEALLRLLGPAMLLLLLVVMAFTIPLLMAYWFAPALVVLDGQRALEAMKLSFRGCLRNVLPFLVYGVGAMLLGLLALLPFVILLVLWPPAGHNPAQLYGYLPVFYVGLLLISPTIIASMYCSYRDIFHGAGPSR